MILKIKIHIWQLNITMVNNYIVDKAEIPTQQTKQFLLTNRFFHYSYNNSRLSIVYIPITQPSLNTQIKLSSPKP